MAAGYSEWSSGSGALLVADSLRLVSNVKAMSNFSSKNNFRQKSPTKRFLSILGLFMFAFYFGLGLTVIFWDNFPLEIDPTYKKLFGILLIVYSFLRFARLWQNNFRN